MKNYIAFLLIFITCFAFAQENESGKSNGTLNEQFDYIMQKSNDFQEYKVVKKDYLLQLKKSSNDSVQKIQKELVGLKKQTASHQTVVSQLKDTLKTTQANLKELQIAQDNVDMFGTTMSKTNYNYLMWGIVSALFFILILVFFQLRSAKSSANESKGNLDKTETDFEDYKHKALEKEQKLGRQLQDEINKHKAGK
jgi:preprotein translocase subunit SecF